MDYKILDGYKKKNGYDLFVDGQIVEIMDILIKGLKEEPNAYVQEQLNILLQYVYNIDSEILISKTVKKGNQTQYKYNKKILYYLINLYKDGVCDKNNKCIILPNKELSNYYLYLFMKRVSGDSIFKGYTYSKEEQKLDSEFKNNQQNVEYDYFKTIVKKYKEQSSKAKIKKKMELEKRFLHLLSLLMKSKDEYIQLLSSLESLKFGEYAINGRKTNLEIFEGLVKKYYNLANIEDENIRILLAQCFSRGVYNNTQDYIIEPNPIVANKFGICPSGSKHKPERKGKIYVCSDIHGQYNVYKKVINFLKPEDTLYILGDVIDKGPDGIKILQDLISSDKQKNVQFIMGNHEYMMWLALVCNVGLNNWISFNNGGEKTYHDFLNLSKEEQKTIISFFNNAVVAKNLTINNQKFQLVHANRCTDFTSESIYFKDFILAKDSAKINELEDMLSSRAYDDFKENAFAIVGHTPNTGNKIEVKGKYIKVDCGLATRSNGNLCMFCLNNMQHIYFSIRNQDIER